MYYLKARAVDIPSGKRGTLSFVVRGDTAISALTRAIKHFEGQYDMGKIVDFKAFSDMDSLRELYSLFIVVP